VSAWFLLIVSILSGTAGDLLTAKAMRDHGEIHDFRPGTVARAIAWLSRDFSMLTGILAQAVSFFTQGAYRERFPRRNGRHGGRPRL
jgi:hypothetical protein